FFCNEYIIPQKRYGFQLTLERTEFALTNCKDKDKKDLKDLMEDKITFKDFMALATAFIQLLYPFILISIAVFCFLMWFLTNFWL
ncbi:MAG: hypothetical protein ACYDG2_25735, partial [Ruminiclostridium sp.]